MELKGVLVVVVVQLPTKLENLGPWCIHIWFNCWDGVEKFLGPQTELVEVFEGFWKLRKQHACERKLQQR